MYSKDDKVCDLALELSCDELGCEPEKQIPRTRLDRFREDATKQSRLSDKTRTEGPRPRVHFGIIASGDSVVKSAHHRDELASSKEVIGFEMEGAGVWESLPVVIIKSVVDYADSHKNYKWQEYGAACAAACMKAFLNEWRATNDTPQPQLGPG